MAKQPAPGPESHAFQAEVAKLLEIVINSLYSEKQIFLRELISNASDSCDKLRYRALTEPDILGEDPELAVTVSFDEKARTITVADNGVGMDHDELIANLGTIAHSGSSEFLSGLTGDPAKDVALIGQFGVGFYSAFMVARRVEVFSRKAGEAQGWRWVSEGRGAFEIEPAAEVARGARIVLHLRKGENAYLDADALTAIIKKYSDHIALPIRLVADGETRTVNAASALWARPKKEITEAQYAEFYHHVAHGFDQPWLTLHLRAEGKIGYAALLYVPGARPFDLFDPARRHGVKLYVRRIFITDSCAELVPSYLRFLRGVVDSDDLPLNVSRETLQRNPILRRIRDGVVKRLFAALAKKAEKAPDDYARFWENFGAVLKEGLYEDPDRRAAIFGLARFRSTRDPAAWTALDDYVARMREGQEAIYYIVGDELETLSRSPQIEGFADKGVEVLLLTDPIDEFWIGAIGDYAETPFRSVTKGVADLGAIARPEGAGEEAAGAGEGAGEVAALVAMVKLTLGDEVKDVRASERLTDSPVCLVADEGDVDMHLERLLRHHQQVEGRTARILELNPRHPLIRGLARRVGQDGANDDLAAAARLLYDQARILEGEPLPDAASFARRLEAAMMKGFTG